MARDRTSQWGAAVTPSDTTDLPALTFGVYVGGAGNLTVDFADVNAKGILLAGVPAGSILPIQVVRVRQTGTTATNIVALY